MWEKFPTIPCKIKIKQITHILCVSRFISRDFITTGNDLILIISSKNPMKFVYPFKDKRYFRVDAILFITCRHVTL